MGAAKLVYLRTCSKGGVRSERPMLKREQKRDQPFLLLWREALTVFVALYSAPGLWPFLRMNHGRHWFRPLRTPSVMKAAGA